MKGLQAVFLVLCLVGLGLVWFGVRFEDGALRAAPGAMGRMTAGLWCTGVGFVGFFAAKFLKPSGGDGGGGGAS